MPRSYRSIVLASVGWLILGAQHPNPPANPEQAKTDARVADALQNIAATYHEQAERARRPPEREPCGPRQYNSNSELCAEWYSARATRDAADWAFWALIISIVGAFGIVIALILTIQSNRIARETAKRQLRAYVEIVSVKVEPPEHDQGVVTVEIMYTNGGETPAYDSVAFFQGVFYAGANRDTDVSEAVSEESPGKKSILGGASHKNVVPMPNYQGMVEQIIEGNLVVFVHGWIRYRDIFGQHHETKMRYFIDSGSIKNPHGIGVAARGNSST